MSNIWKQFQNLIADDVTLVGTVTSTDGTNSTVELLSGDYLRGRGTGTVGNMVYVKSGEIIQEAAAMTQYNLILY